MTLAPLANLRRDGRSQEEFLVSLARPFNSPMQNFNFLKSPRQRFAGAVAILLVFVAAWYAFGPRRSETIKEPMTFRLEGTRAVFQGSNRVYSSSRADLVEYVRRAPTNRAMVTIRLNRLVGTPVFSYRFVDVDMAPFLVGQ